MKYHVIDNSLKDLGKTVLWQYDRAVRLLSVMKHMQVLYHCAVEQFWDWWTKRVLSIDTLDAFGCSLWGMFLGVPRPTITDEDGSKRLIATSVYRKLLKGAFYLTKASCTFEDILGYLEIVFGVSGEDSLSKWTVYVSEYGWTTNIDELNDRYQSNRVYQAGDIFWWSTDADPIGGNWKCLRYIKAKENTSFETLHNAGWITATREYTNGMRDDDTVLLKLIDPEGIVRKIGGAPSNSLSVTVEYEMGSTTIKAVASRRRKCGVSLTDNYDLTMTYAKSPYYDEMHKDQKALFEQKKDELCPFPLGIKSNEIAEDIVFGFGQDEWPGGVQDFVPNAAYAVNTLLRYPEGAQEDKNGYWEFTNGTYNYVEYPVYYICRVTEPIQIGEFPTLLAFYNSKKKTDMGIWQYGNIPYMYHSGVFFPRGLTFCHVDADGRQFVYQCTKDISADENTSFEAISGFAEKTKTGNPAIGGLVLDDEPYIDLRKLHFKRIHGGSITLMPNIDYRNTCVLTYVNGLAYVIKFPITISIIYSFDKTLEEPVLALNYQILQIKVNKYHSMESLMALLGDFATERGYEKISPERLETYSKNICYYSGMAAEILGKKTSFVKTVPSGTPRDLESISKIDGYPTWKSHIMGD